MDEQREWVEDFIQKEPRLKLELIQELQRFFLQKPNSTQDDIDTFRYVAFPILEFYAKRYIFVGLLVVGMMLIFYYMKRRLREIINFKKFLNFYEKGMVKKIVIHPEASEIFVIVDAVLGEKSGVKKYVLYTNGKEFEKKLQFLMAEKKGKKNFGNFDIFFSSQRIPYPENNIITTASIIITIGGILYLMSGYTNGIGQSVDQLGGLLQKTVKSVDSNLVNTKFADVAGLFEQKKEITEYLSFLQEFEKYKDIGSRLPRGVLMTGPPGCGKTLLAKALAGECGIPFFSVSGSEFVEMIVGIGPQRVRTLFEDARENEPSIIFIDEIDAVGTQRGTGKFFSFLPERENTLNQLLIEMDGFNENENVIVIAATNRPQILDKALLRPGRFDRRIEISLPNVKEREEMFELYLKDMKLPSKGISYDDPVKFYAVQLAKLTPGMSGADISNVCNEAALLGTRDEAEYVGIKYFEDAIDKVVGGLERKSKMKENEKNVVAVHEAGHALAGWLLPHAEPVLKVSIIPRSSGMLGFTQYLYNERAMYTRDQLYDMICVLLGGRVAEDIMYGEKSTGAQNDIERATDMIRTMITEFGMSKGVVKNISWDESDYIMQVERSYSSEMQKVIDEEVHEVMKELYDKTMSIMKDNKDKLVKISNLLLERETIDGKEILDEIKIKPKNMNVEFDEFIESLRKAKENENL